MDLSTILSLVALGVSSATAWFSIFHRGSVQMTHPSFIALLKGDGPNPNLPKIFLRTLLYTTGKRGQALEHMFIKIHQGGRSQTFPFWGSGETTQLTIGSGIFIGPDGHAANHHFLLPEDCESFEFTPGALAIEIYGSVARNWTPRLLCKLDLFVPEDQVNAFNENPHNAVFFTWNPDEEKYHSRIDERPPKRRTHSVSGSGHGPFFFE